MLAAQKLLKVLVAVKTSIQQTCPSHMRELACASTATVSPRKGDQTVDEAISTYRSRMLRSVIVQERPSAALSLPGRRHGALKPIRTTLCSFGGLVFNYCTYQNSLSARATRNASLQPQHPMLPPHTARDTLHSKPAPGDQSSAPPNSQRTVSTRKRSNVSQTHPPMALQRKGLIIEGSKCARHELARSHDVA